MHPSVLVRLFLSPFLFAYDLISGIGLALFIACLNVLSWINQSGEEYIGPGETFAEFTGGGFKNTWKWIWNGS